MLRGARFSELPEDLVAGILARLPPREIPRARFVCRRWRALTTDRHFLRTALAFSRRAGHAGAGGFFINDQYCFRSEYFPFPFPLPPDRIREAEAAAECGLAAPAPDLAFIPSSAPSADHPGGDTGNVHVCSSCDGLLLVFCPAALYVCNPLTRELAPIIPVPNGLMYWPSLAFDSSISRHYKVVSLDVMYAIHVYSSETRCWRMAVHPDRSVGMFVGLRSFRGVFWNGSMVWTLGHSLIRFVLQGDQLMKIPMPPKTKTGWICGYIGESAGHLQMIGYTKEDKLSACFDVLELQDDQSEWSLLYRVDLSRVKELYPEIEKPTWDTRGHLHKIIDYLALSPVCVIPGTRKAEQQGVFVFSIPGKIMSYKMEDRTISMIQEVVTFARGMRPPYHLEHPWYNIYAYNPSLFTCKHYLFQQEHFM